MTQPRQVFFVDETMRTPNGYVPALVTEGEGGYSPMIGSGEFAQPWYWGHDIEIAKKICDDTNTKRGISPEEARDIVAESITIDIRDSSRNEAAQARWERIKAGRD